MPHYIAHGLKIFSELTCPELMPASDDAPADASFVLGATPESLDAPTGGGATYQARANEFLLSVPGVARFWVQDGMRITIEPDAGAGEDVMRLFLMGSALGALLVQRGQVILHGSAIETERGAVVFVGRSGIGKSTTAAAYQQCGHRVLTDDVCTIAWDAAAQRACVHPGLAHLKLWADSRDKLALQETAARRVRPELEKYALPLLESYDPRPVLLHAVYILQTAPRNDAQAQAEWKIEELGRLEKARALEHNLYRLRFVDDLGRREQIFQELTRATRRVRVCRVTRPEKGFRLEELVERIAADWTAS